MINRRAIRHTMGTRATRRAGTKMNGTQFKYLRRPRPKTRMKQLVRDAKT